jgi:hypothetical protein
MDCVMNQKMVCCKGNKQMAVTQHLINKIVIFGLLFEFI